MRWIILTLILTDAAYLRAGTQVKAKVTTTAKGGLDEVITLLQTMLTKFSNHFTEDRTNWEAYSQFSEDQETEKNSFVQEQEAVVMSQTALLNSKKELVAKLGADLTTLGQDIAKTETSIKELTEMRGAERQQHEAELSDLTRTITAVTKALEVLAGHYAASPATLQQIRQTVQMGMTVLQLHGDITSQRPVLPNGATEFLQSGNPDWLANDGTQYETMNAQGGGTTVMSMLNDMKGQLEDTKTQSIARENESRRQYEETKQAKVEEHGRMKAEEQEKSNLKLQAEAAVEKATSTIDQASRDIADAKTFLETLLADRKKYQAEYEERQQMRQNERAATQAALDALQSVSAGNSASALNQQQVQVSSGFTEESQQVQMSFVQVSQTPRMLSLTQQLQNPDFNIPQPALAMITQSLQSRQGGYMDQERTAGFSGDEMEPVKNLLRELVRKLEDEANAESSHHDWCEEEKAGSVTGQQEREHIIHTMKQKVETGSTSIAQLKSEILFLREELVRIAKETEQALALRKAQKEEYERAKADHDEVISALESAITAMTGQYSFMQGGSANAPFGEYQSGADGASSVIQMLQDLLNRYTQARTELIQNEESAQKAHDELLIENENFRIDTTNSRDAKTSERRASLGELGNNKVELKTSMLELQQVNQYLQDLRPSCDDIRSTFEERKKRREAEIAALKEALEALADPNMM